MKLNLNSYICLVATILDSTGIHQYHCQLITYWNERKPQNLPTSVHVTIQKAKVQLTAISDKQVRE